MALSESQVRALLATADGRAIADAVRRAAWVERFRNGRVRDVDAVVRSVAEQLRAAARGRLERLVGRTHAAPSSMAAAEVERRIAQILRQAVPKALDVVSPALRELAVRQGARVGVAGARALGQTAQQHFSGWATSTARRARAAISHSLAQGESAAEAVARMDDVIATARRQAATLVRTMSDAVAVQAREREISRDGFELVRYVAVLDERTTELCEELNGTVWPVGEGPRPPQHYGCRSFIAPAESDAREYAELTLQDLEEAA